MELLRPIMLTVVTGLYMQSYIPPNGWPPELLPNPTYCDISPKVSTYSTLMELLKYLLDVLPSKAQLQSTIQVMVEEMLTLDNELGGHLADLFPLLSILLLDGHIFQP